ncbi:hypothetical protein GCM10010182_60910 [Actinomadura cremea]|nr:hypothetical protein GCM10010182_60910 [Actinomadura cremea]
MDPGPVRDRAAASAWSTGRIGAGLARSESNHSHVAHNTPPCCYRIAIYRPRPPPARTPGTAPGTHCDRRP